MSFTVIVPRHLCLRSISLRFPCPLDIDKTTMSYQSGEKCLSVLGFTRLKNVPRHLFGGKGVLYIAAQKGDSVRIIYLSVNSFI
jgi:hypothetical protein